MISRQIFSENIELFKPVLWEGVPVCLHYAVLKNYISTKLGNEYSSIFSEPDIPKFNKGKANWNSSQIQKGKKLSELNDLEKEKIKKHIDYLLSKLYDLSLQLLDSENSEDRNWGQMLRSALVIPGDEYIIVEDDFFCLVFWGYNKKKETENTFQLLRFINFKSNILKESANQEKEAKHEPEINSNLQTEKETLDNRNEENDEKRNEQTFSENLTEDFGKKTIDPEPKKPSNKKVVYVLIILLSILTLIYILTHIPKTEHLPERPGVINPIDTSKIVEDPDSVRLIISDKLIVTLIGRNKNIKLFAKRFKEEYPSDGYSITYYPKDSILHRIEITIPSDRREKIKKELKSKMKDFDLLIMHEGLYKNKKIPNDPAFNNINKSWFLNTIKAEQAWDYTEGDPNLIVAIIDDGFDLSSIEFKGKIYKPWNAVSGTRYVNTGSSSKHGTHVASIALANSNNSFGLSGVAPKCKFMPVQVGDYWGRMSTLAIVDGLIYAIDHGAKVINMSLGMQVSSQFAYYSIDYQRRIINSVFKDEEEFWSQLFAYAYKRNVIIILAGGNDNVLCGIDPMQRSKKTIKVSATDQNNKKANFSNYGSYTTISAPGVNIYSSIPFGRFEYMDGTSMAAPMVTGAVALIKSANPSLSFNQIADLLQSTGLNVNNGIRNIGKIIQLDKALEIASQNRRKMPIANCGEVQLRIDSLLQEIDKLRKSCQNNEKTTNDTLKIPPGSHNLNFAKGKWQSTSDLYSTNDGMKVTIVFDFTTKGEEKIVMIHTDHTICEARMNISLTGDKFLIDQITKNECNPQNREYNPYHFVCQTSANGCAECIAQNNKKSNNRFIFNLVKLD